MRLAVRFPVQWTTVHKVAVVSFLGQLYFYIPALTPYLLARGLSLAQISGLQAILIVSQLALEVPTGVVADRFGRRWSVTLGVGAQVLAARTFQLARDWTAFVLAQIFAGAGYALISGSKDALVYDSLPPGDRTEGMLRASGLIGAATQSASVVAYLVGGLLVASLAVGHISFAIALTVVAMFVAFVATFAISEPPTGIDSEERRGSLELLLDGLRLFRANAELRRIVLLYLVTNAFGVYLLVLYHAYFLEAGVPGIWFGVALTVGSVFAVFGQRYASLLPKMLGTRRGVLVATAAPGVLYVLMALTVNPVLAVTLFCLPWGATFVGGALFAGGTVVGVLIVPLAIQFLTHFFQVLDLEQLLDINSYIMFIVLIAVIFGITFELPIFMVGFSLLGIVNSRFFIQKFRVAIFVIFGVSMVITPGADLVSPLVLGTFLIVLYWLGVLLIRIIGR